MAFDFPNSPTVGQVYNSPITGVAYTWDGQKWGPGPTGSGSGSTSVTISDTPPASPSTGNLWWESDTGNIYIYYADANSSQWVMIVGGAGAKVVTVPVGQCILTRKTGSSLALMPLRGNLLTINGVNCTIPDAGVSLAAAGLTANTLYYIYAVATAGVVTSLEASTTSHFTSVTAGNNGVEIKLGDDTRSLVGMVYVLAGPVFTDTATQRYVRSWYNRQRMPMRSAIVGSNIALTGIMSEIAGALRMNFVCWADDAVSAAYNVMFFSSVTGTISYQMNYTGSFATGATTVINSDATSRVTALPLVDATFLNEGLNYITLGGSIVTGTASTYSATFGSGAVG